MIGLELPAAMENIADDEFAQERKANGCLAQPYSNWRRWANVDPDATMDGAPAALVAS